MDDREILPQILPLAQSLGFGRWEDGVTAMVFLPHGRTMVNFRGR